AGRLAPGSCRPLEGHLLVCPHTEQMTARALSSEYVKLTAFKAHGRGTRCSVEAAYTARPVGADQDFICETIDLPTAVSVNDHVLRQLDVDGGRLHSLPSLPQCRPLPPPQLSAQSPYPYPLLYPRPYPLHLIAPLSPSTHTQQGAG